MALRTLCAQIGAVIPRFRRALPHRRRRARTAPPVKGVHDTAVDQLDCLGRRRVGEAPSTTGRAVRSAQTGDCMSRMCQPLGTFSHRSAPVCTVQKSAGGEKPKQMLGFLMVLPVGIEPTTSPLPRECSTTELRQPGANRGAGEYTRVFLLASSASPSSLPGAERGYSANVAQAETADGRLTATGGSQPRLSGDDFLPTLGIRPPPAAPGTRLRAICVI